MMLQNVFLPSRAVNVGIYFSGQNTFMSQHFLDCPQISPSFYKMCGKRMPESMRRDFFRDTGFQRLLLHHVEYGYAAQLPSRLVQEQDIVKFRQCRFRSDFQIFQDGVARRFAHRDDPFLVTFPHYPDETIIDIDIGDSYGRSLGNP